MKTIRYFLIITFLGIFLLSGTSCSLFGPKYGCPSNGKNVGAEKILAGEKVKAKKFKS
jgi:hypothetical protein